MTTATPSANGVASIAGRLKDIFAGRGRHIAFDGGWTENKTDLTERVIRAHLEGRATVGAFTGTAESAGFGFIDTDAHFKDAHGNDRDPTPAEVEANERYALGKHDELNALGVRHVLFRHDRRGSYHLVIRTDGIESARLGRWLKAFVRDAAACKVTVETFPFDNGTPKGCRLPGQHHKHPDDWTELYVGGEWLSWPAAGHALADLEPNPADKFPDPGPDEEPEQTAWPKAKPRAAELDNGAHPGERPGDHYDRVTDIHRLLLDSGFVVHSRSGDRVYYTRPGKKTADGLSGSVLGNSFWLFTNAVDGLKPSAENGKKPYRPFGLFAYLNQNGDFSAAASELARLGFGYRQPEAKVTWGKGEPAADGGQDAGTSTGEADKPAAEPSPAPSEPEWPDPMAAEAFHGPAGELVNLILPATEADPAGLLVQTLVAFGSLAGRHRYCVAEADRHHPNENVVLVGRTARGRKGSSYGRVRAVLAGVDPEWADNRIQSGLSSGEGLIWAVRDPIVTREKFKSMGQVTFQDVESDPGVKDKRLQVLEPEFANVLKQTERQGNTLSVIVRDAWDRGKLSTLTKNSPARATDAHVSIIGHITDEELRRYLTTTETCNGFANRFMFVCVKRSKSLPDGGRVDARALAAVGAKLRKAAEFASTDGPVSRDDHAREVWHGVYPALTEDRPGMIGNLLARAESHVLRLSLIYALLDCSPFIRVEHLAAAVAVWEYCDQSARYVFGEALGDPLADDLLRLIRGCKDGITRTDISTYLNRHAPASRIDQALGLLLRHGRAHPRQVSTGGEVVRGEATGELVRLLRFFRGGLLVHESRLPRARTGEVAARRRAKFAHPRSWGSTGGRKKRSKRTKPSGVCRVRAGHDSRPAGGRGVRVGRVPAQGGEGMTDLSTCRNCGRAIRWVRCGRDRPIAIDPQPHPRGTVVLDEYGRCGPDHWQAAAPDMTERFMRHRTTCPEDAGPRKPCRPPSQATPFPW